MKKKLLTWVFRISGAVVALGLVCFAALFLAFRITPTEQASIGIIGGADGPTAVFVASQAAPGALLLLCTAAAVFAGTGLALLPGRKKK